MIMRNKIGDLRDHLFVCIEELMDKDETIGSEKMDRIKMVNDLGKTLVDSAKVEVGYIKALKQTEKSSFIPLEPIDPEPKRNGYAITD